MLRGSAGLALPTRPLAHAHRPGQAQLGMNAQVEAATAWAADEESVRERGEGAAPAAQAAAHVSVSRPCDEIRLEIQGPWAGWEVRAAVVPTQVQSALSAGCGALAAASY